MTTSPPAGDPMNDDRTTRPRFLTVAEVAAELRVSTMTVYRLIHSDELQAVKVGRSYRVPEVALDRFLADQGITVG